MRCSLSPLARASAVCMLMQLVHPLICDARIFTSSMRLGSRLAAASIDMLIHFFMSSGAALKISGLGVMIDIPFFGLRHHDEPVLPPCDMVGNIFLPFYNSSDQDRPIHALVTAHTQARASAR